MTAFENFLIEKGYIRFAFDAAKGKYYEPKLYVISTMSNLGHLYIHESDVNLLSKIKEDKSITPEDRKNEIIFGLHEKDRPPTLIYPRPRIKIKRTKEDKIIIEDEQFDDSMNIVLQKENFNQILKAMYNKSICFEYDLTK
jgi:hypothetical protein